MSISDSAYIRRFFSLYSQEEKDKVRGLAFYSTDYLSALLPEGIAYVGVIRSPHAGASFSAIQSSEALKISGVLKVITAKDVPHNLPYGKRSKRVQLLLAESQVRYVGEPVAIVVAETKEALRQALSKVAIDWKVDAKREPEVTATIHHRIGTPVRANLKEVKSPFKFPSLKARYLEAECGWVDFKKEKLIFHVGSLLSESQRQWISQVLEIPFDSVLANESPLGGQFGGRQQRELIAFLALSSWLTKRSTCLIFEPNEQDTGSYGYEGELCIRFDEESKQMKELKGRLTVDAGSYEGNAQFVLQKALEHITGIYDFQYVDIEGQVICTPTHPRRALRGEGLAAVTWVTEQLVEQVAKLLDQKPMEFRTQNCRLDADKVSSVLTEMEKLERPFRLVPIDRSKPVWDEKPIVGRGMAFQYFRPAVDKEFDLSEVSIELQNSGSFVIKTSNLTLDLHAKQALCEVAAAVLKTHPKAFVVEGNMRIQVDKAARRETYPEFYYLAQTTWHAAAALRDKIQEAGKKIFQSQTVILKDGAITETSLNRKMGYREVAFTEGGQDLKASYILQNVEKPHGCSAGAVSRVAFHPLTGELRVESVKVVLDAGPVLYQKGLEIQVESSISWAMAALFSSELESDQPIPTTLDGPEESTLVTLEYPIRDLAEKPLDYFGSRGNSDTIMSVILASLVNAIYEAKDIPLDEIPMSTEFMYPKRRQQTVLNFPLKRF